MATWLKQSTAVDIAMGPFLDATDGVTAETALTITQPDIRLKKNGGAWAQKNAAQTLSHEEAGWYEVALDTTDTNTLGILIVAIAESGALPVWREFMVVPANVYDALVGGSDLLQVDTTQIEGVDATDQLDAHDGAPLDAEGVRSAVGLASANLDTQLTALPTAAAVADAVWDEATSGHQTAGTTGKALTDAGAAGTPPTAAAIADAVWDEAISGHAGAGSTGEALSSAAAGSAAGPGAIAWVVEVDDGTDPIEGAHVWVSTDAAGSNVVAGSLITDSFGRATFMLDAGTYHAFIRKDGFNPVLADDFVVA